MDTPTWNGLDAAIPDTWFSSACDVTVARLPPATTQAASASAHAIGVASAWKQVFRLSAEADQPSGQDAVLSPVSQLLSPVGQEQVYPTCPPALAGKPTDLHTVPFLHGLCCAHTSANAHANGRGTEQSLAWSTGTPDDLSLRNHAQLPSSRTGAHGRFTTDAESAHIKGDLLAVGEAPAHTAAGVVCGPRASLGADEYSHKANIWPGSPPTKSQGKSFHWPSFQM